MARAVALALACVFVSCAGSKKPPRDFLGEPVPKQCAHDEETEFCVGWWMDRLLVSLFGMRPYDDPAITRYVTDVGQRLARAAGDRRDWKFRVLDDPTVQAFVISGTTVYIHRGTLAILRSEAELAAVLAHEMGHLRGGHTREKFQDLGRDVQRSDLEKSLQHQYDRDDEIQADESAVLLLARAGYDPNAVETMLRALAGTARYDAVEDPDDVHPWWPERIARAQGIPKPPRGELGEDRYRTRVASLIVGPDPRRISLVGTTAVFASAKAAVDLPPFTASSIADDTLEVTLVVGGKVKLTSVNADVAKLMAAVAEDNQRVLEVHHETAGEAITISVVDRPDAAFLARTLRAAMRDPTSAELARLTPQRVDLGAPRRLWATAR